MICIYRKCIYSFVGSRHDYVGARGRGGMMAGSTCYVAQHKISLSLGKKD